MILFKKLCITVACITFVALICIANFQFRNHPVGLPPDYRVLCDHKGKYAVGTTRYNYIYPETYSSRKTATHIAWQKHESDMRQEANWQSRVRKEQDELQSRFTECNEIEKDKQ